MLADEQPPADEPVPWRPNEAMTSQTSLSDVLSVLGMGQFDQQSFAAIARKLSDRNVKTVGKLKACSKSELISMISIEGIKKSARAYVQCIGLAIEHDFMNAGAAVDDAGEMDTSEKKGVITGTLLHLH